MGDSGPIASLFGSGLKAGGSISSGIIGRRTALENAGTLEADAARARALEGVATTQAGIEAERFRSLGRRVVGVERAAAGASGIDPNLGSPMLVQLDTVHQAAQDAWMARYKGDMRAYELENQALTFESAAAAMKRKGRTTLLGGLLGGGAALAEGVARVKWPSNSSQTIANYPLASSAGPWW